MDKTMKKIKRFLTSIAMPAPAKMNKSYYLFYSIQHFRQDLKIVLDPEVPFGDYQAGLP
jgi:hypothetical protein